VVQSGFRNLSFAIRNNILSGQGDKKAGFGEVLNTIGDGLVHKNLLHPPNWNILFDLLCIVCILGLCIGANIKEWPVWICAITMLLFMGACFGWIVRYVRSQKK
jgi:hypothetical protein